MLSHYKPLSALDSTYYLRDTVGNDAEVVIPQCYREGIARGSSRKIPYTMLNCREAVVGRLAILYPIR